MHNRNSYYMYGGSAWFSRVSTDIEQQRFTLSPRDFRRYKLELLLRIAYRVDGLSQTCGECLAFKDKITRRLDELTAQFQMHGKTDRQFFKDYSGAVKNMVTHLKKNHGLVDRHHYMGIGSSIGTGAGAALGGALNQLSGYAGVGTIAGILLGLAIGWYLDKKAEREGRVI